MADAVDEVFWRQVDKAKKAMVVNHLKGDVIDFVLKLLNITPAFRLGSDQDGSKQVKSHMFFKTIQWKKLEQRQLEPPFYPDSYDMDRMQRKGAAIENNMLNTGSGAGQGQGSGKSTPRSNEGIQIWSSIKKIIPTPAPEPKESQSREPTVVKYEPFAQRMQQLNKYEWLDDDPVYSPSLQSSPAPLAQAPQQQRLLYESVHNSSVKRSRSSDSCKHTGVQAGINYFENWYYISPDTIVEEYRHEQSLLQQQFSQQLLLQPNFR